MIDKCNENTVKTIEAPILVTWLLTHQQDNLFYAIEVFNINLEIPCCNKLTNNSK